MSFRNRLLGALIPLLLAGCALGSAAPPPPAPPSLAAAGGQIRLWQDASIFDAVHALLGPAAAGEPVWVEMYEFGRTDLGLALRTAWRHGADVRVIVDRTVRQSARMADRLAAAGLPVRAYPVDDRRHQIDHVKLLLAGAAALVGGMNWGATSAANHDYAFETTSPRVVDRLRRIFEQDWALAGGRPEPLGAEPGPVAQTTPGQEIRASLVGSIRLAHRAVQAEVFVLTDPEVITELAGARRRGARVRVLLDPHQDVNRPGSDLLRLAGVDVRWYPVPVGAKLHAKAALFDGRRLLLGSANWSQGGLSVNHELDLLSDDGAAAAAFARRFEQDWSAAG